MKNNTYIIPAVDFCLVIPQGNTTFLTYEETLTKIKDGECSFIPFEQVDGLIIDALLIPLPDLSNGFAVCAINQMMIADMKTKNSYYFHNVLDVLFFSNDDIEKFGSKTIDKIVEEQYEIRYSMESNNKRRIFNSFFEKYQDENYEETKKRVKRLSIENNRK